MRENKVTNILFIVFTVMALAGTASLVKTAIAPKENMQETEQKASAKGRAVAYSAEQQEQMRVFDEYEQKTLGTEYDSFSEALQAAESIDPNEINPFPLWNEMGGSSLEK